MGLAGWGNTALGAAALATMVGSLLYSRFARQRWTDRQVQRFQGIKASIQEYAGNSTVVVSEGERQFQGLRTGDAGRGFAVVADEVRSLAKRTSQFSAQIRHLLGEIEVSISSVNVSVDQATNTDLSVATQSKENVAGMWT